jgi:hypothetical protein
MSSEDSILDFERVQKKVFENSELIYSLEYNRILMELVVFFTTGVKYKYFGVDQQIVDRFCSDESPGRFFNAFFRKGQFKTQKIED